MTDYASALYEGPRALTTFVVGRQAKGMVMAAQGGEDEAFDLLVKASPRSNRKRRAIAEELVDRAVRRRAGSTTTEQP